MTAWIVAEGEARPYDPTDLPDRDTYGTDWAYVEAADAAEALARATAWDAIPRGAGPLEVEMFVAAYRAGAVLLPGDALVGINDIADRAGVARDTVNAWRRRHSSFPAPLSDHPPRWAWSDVAHWRRIPRRAGRPPKVTHAPSS